MVYAETKIGYTALMERLDSGRARSPVALRRESLRPILAVAASALVLRSALVFAQSAELATEARTPPIAGTFAAVSPPAAATAPDGPSVTSSVSEPKTAIFRQLVPAAPVEDLRLRKLDTGLPAEPAWVDTPPAAVVAPQPNAATGPARRTVLRTVDGVTVLTNVSEPNDSEASSVERPVRPAPIMNPTTTELARTVSRDNQRLEAGLSALNPATKDANSRETSRWLWLLSGAAIALLVPIGVLLSRPARKG